MSETNMTPEKYNELLETVFSSQEPGVYFRNVGRPDAEAYVKSQGEGTYVVRPSKRPFHLSVTFHSLDGTVGHSLINKSAKGWAVSGSENSYPSVRKLIENDFHGIKLESLDEYAMPPPMANMNGEYSQAPAPANYEVPAKKDQLYDLPQGKEGTTYDDPSSYRKQNPYGAGPPEKKYDDVSLVGGSDYSKVPGVATDYSKLPPPVNPYAQVPGERKLGGYSRIPAALAASASDEQGSGGGVYGSISMDIIRMTEPAIDYRDKPRPEVESELLAEGKGANCIRPSTVPGRMVLSFVHQDTNAIKHVLMDRCEEGWSIKTADGTETAPTIRALLEKVSPAYGLKLKSEEELMKGTNQQYSDYVKIALSDLPPNESFKKEPVWQPHMSRQYAEEAIRECSSADVGIVRPSRKADAAFAVTYRLGGKIYNTPLQLKGNKYAMTVDSGLVFFDNVDKVFEYLEIEKYRPNIENQYDDIPNELRALQLSKAKPNEPFYEAPPPRS